MTWGGFLPEPALFTFSFRKLTDFSVGSGSRQARNFSSNPA
jgi:hypothetical protein